MCLKAWLQDKMSGGFTNPRVSHLFKMYFSARAAGDPSSVMIHASLPPPSTSPYILSSILYREIANLLQTEQPSPTCVCLYVKMPHHTPPHPTPLCTTSTTPPRCHSTISPAFSHPTATSGALAPQKPPSCFSDIDSKSAWKVLALKLIALD